MEIQEGFFEKSDYGKKKKNRFLYSEFLTRRGMGNPQRALAALAYPCHHLPVGQVSRPQRSDFAA